MTGGIPRRSGKGAGGTVVIMDSMKFLCTLLFLSFPLAAQEVTVPMQVVSPAAATIDPNKVILQVGEIKITAQQLDYLIDVYPANAQVYYRGPGRQQFADVVVRMLVLAEEGRKRKLNDSEKF